MVVAYISLLIWITVIAGIVMRSLLSFYNILSDGIIHWALVISLDCNQADCSDYWLQSVIRDYWLLTIISNLTIVSLSKMLCLISAAVLCNGTAGSNYPASDIGYTSSSSSKSFWVWDVMCSWSISRCESSGLFTVLKCGNFSQLIWMLVFSPPIVPSYTS